MPLPCLARLEKTVGALASKGEQAPLSLVSLSIIIVIAIVVVVVVVVALQAVWPLLYRWRQPWH